MKLLGSKITNVAKTWGGQRGDFTGHAKAVAYLLRDMTPASDSWECSFEAEVATTLCIHVVRICVLVIKTDRDAGSHITTDH